MKKFCLITNLIFCFLFIFSLNSVVNAQVSEEKLGYVVFARPKEQSLLKEISAYEWLNSNELRVKLKDTEEELSLNLIHILSPEEGQDYYDETVQKIDELFSMAKKIEIEVFENNIKESDVQDSKEQFMPTIIWLDGVMLQEILLTEGFAVIQLDEVTDTEEYLEVMAQSQDYARENQFKIWDNLSNPFLKNAEFPMIVINKENGNYEVSNNSKSDHSNNFFSIPSNDPKDYQKVGDQSSQNKYNNSSQPQQPTYTESSPVYEEPVQAYQEPAPAENVYYGNCTIARQAGAAPVYQGQPGYGRHLDRDGDGIGCE